ncbi:MAG: hypothetical protein GTN80_00995 [Nitrososphaeria archaeon]|nr:hypothetical protein [Nitrososphaeria archaeon]NIN51728.1 hypothetical protein [Nitrososphaeria archaeon]NIQ32222.1 hypothetical protein [Nitrososphaeria archaeon]
MTGSSPFSYQKIYDTTRARTLRSLLLTQESLDALASARGVREVIMLLDASSLRDYLDLTGVDDETSFRSALSNYLHRVFDSLTVLTSDFERYFLDLYPLRRELEVYKQILGLWLQGRLEEDRDSIPSTQIFSEKVLDTFSGRDAFTLVDIPLPTPLLRGLPTKISEVRSETTPEGINEVFNLLDKNYYTLLWDTAIGQADASLLKELIGLEIDVTNIERVLRGLNLNIEREKIVKQLIPIYFRISEEALTSVLRSRSVEEAFLNLPSTRYDELLQSAFSAFSESSRVSEFSYSFKSFIIRNMYRFFSRKSFSVSILAALLRLELFQIDVLETIYRSKSIGLDKEDTLNLIRYFTV